MSIVNEFGVTPYQTRPYQPLQYNQGRAAEVYENPGSIIYDELALENIKNGRGTYLTLISGPPEQTPAELCEE